MRKRKGEEGLKVRKRQKRCRQVCDLFKGLEGNQREGPGVHRGGDLGGPFGVAVVAMEMTRNVSLPLAILMD